MLPIAILAGGLATRLGSVTQDLPKCLIEINGRPFIDWQIDQLRSSGYREMVFCLSHKAKIIQDYLGDGSSFGIKINYSLDGRIQLGTGGAIKKALPLLGPKFAVIYGDSYLPINFQEIDKEFQDSGAPAMMTVYKNSGRYDSSNVCLKNGEIVHYKKGLVNSESEHIDYGLSYFNREVFLNPSLGNVFDLSDILSSLIILRSLACYEVRNRFYEVGSHLGISELSKYLGGNKIEL
jgi:NDP-sugar pyrophosphorylase family protein